MVVIDPGHGGYDSGHRPPARRCWKRTSRCKSRSDSSASSSIAESARYSLATGDYFVTLADRTACANKASADLFISIHLNSSPDAATTGIETYYLNNTTDRATIRLARMENASGGAYGAPAGANLNYILTDLRQHYKANEVGLAGRMIEAETAADLDASTGTAGERAGSEAWAILRAGRRADAGGAGRVRLSFQS